MKYTICLQLFILALTFKYKERRYMSIKVSQFLRPLAKGSSAISLKLIIDNLTYRYVKNIKEQIKVKFFKEGDMYFVYAKIPSESNDKYPDAAPVFYDVIFQFIPPNKASLAADSIREYDVKAFSNIPSFLYTFNYVFYHRKALIELPGGYYSPRALNEKARIRNPLNLLGIDKSLWFTTYYLDDHRFFKRTTFDGIIDKELTLVKLLKKEKIKTQEHKLYELELRDKHRKLKKENERKKRPAGRKRVVIKEPVKKEKIDTLVEKSLSRNNLKSSLQTNSLRSKLSVSNTNRTTRMQNNLKSNLSSHLKTP
jgi:hypothetical protein